VDIAFVVKDKENTTQPLISRKGFQDPMDILAAVLWRLVKRLGGEVLVELVLSQAAAHTLEVGDVVTELLDGRDLLLEVIALDEVGHLGVLVAIGHSMEVEQRLVDALLQSQGHLHGVQTSSPLVTVGLLDVLKDHATATLVLEFHQLLSMLALLVRGALEELGEPWQCHVITVKVERHRLVAVGSIQLHVDLAVDTGLTLGVVVLATLTQGHLGFGSSREFSFFSSQSCEAINGLKT